MGIKQTPNFKSQQDLDISSIAVQTDLATQLKDALQGNNKRVSDILRSKGKLSRESEKELRTKGRRDAAGASVTQRTRAQRGGLSIGRAAVDSLRNQANNRRTSEQRGRINAFEEDQKRSDLGQIFGRVLNQGVGIVSANTGSIKEKAPKRSTVDKFLDGINKGIGDLFCWVARAVLGDDTDDWKHARNWILENGTDADVRMYLQYGAATAQRLTPSEALSLKPFFLSIVEEDKHGHRQ